MFRSGVKRLGAWSVAWAALWLAVAPGPARGECPTEVNAVMLVSGIYPGTSPQITRLHVTRVGMATNPTADELLAAVRAAYALDPLAHIYYHRWVATRGNYDFYLAEASDFGAATIIDRRTAEVLFAGTIVWMGTGHVVAPLTSTHECPVTPGEPAFPPVAVEAFPSLYWGGVAGAAEALAQAGVTLAAQTDFLRSMGGCGDYAVVGYTYTPTVGLTDPYKAVEVLVFGGRLDDTWIPVAVEERTWGGVKALYR